MDYYGASTPLKQLAGISVPEATMLVVQPYDKTALPEIERAIVASDLGITPSNDGNLIRLKVPALTAVSTPESCAATECLLHTRLLLQASVAPCFGRPHESLGVAAQSTAHE